jgi:hypothetical protein
MIQRLVLLAAALAPVLLGVLTESRKTILVSAALTPVLLGVLVGFDPRPRRGLTTLILVVGLFELAYASLLYYVWLRLPW